MSIDHIISEIYNSMIEEVIGMNDNTTLLDYEYWFMVKGRPSTQFLL